MGVWPRLKQHRKAIGWTFTTLVAITGLYVSFQAYSDAHPDRLKEVCGINVRVRNDFASVKAAVSPSPGGPPVASSILREKGEKLIADVRQLEEKAADASDANIARLASEARQSLTRFFALPSYGPDAESAFNTAIDRINKINSVCRVQGKPSWQ